MTSELATKADLAREIGLLRTEMKAEFVAVRAEIATLRTETKAEFAAVRAETKGLIKDLQITLLAFLGGLQVASITILFLALEYVGK